MRRSVGIGCGMAMLAMLFAVSSASAQNLSKTSRTQGRTGGIGGLGGYELPGPGLPEYPPPSFRVHHRTLFIQGSQQDDWIAASESGNEISFIVFQLGDAVLQGSVSLDDVDLIVMYGLAGDDTLVNYTTLPCVPIGGLGNDVYHTL